MNDSPVPTGLLKAELLDGPQVVVKDGDSLAVIPIAGLVGMSELARRLDVAGPTAASWHRRRDRTDFPDPVMVVAGLGPVWDMAAVHDWYTDWRDWAGSSATP